MAIERWWHVVDREAFEKAVYACVHECVNKRVSEMHIYKRVTSVLWTAGWVHLSNILRMRGMCARAVLS